MDEKTLKQYMNPHTGSVDTYDGWYYQNEDGERVNAVDKEEVVPVHWDKDYWEWVETEEE